MNPYILLTAQQARTVDHLTIESGITGAQLMENAGNALAVFIKKIVAANSRDASSAKKPAVPDQAEQKTSVLIACGPGNNGGDGFVAARILQADGWPVRVAFDGDRDKLSGHAKLMANLYDGEMAPLAPAALQGANLIVDALFGTGLSRPIDGTVATFVNAVNENRAPVIAVDIPTGINTDTGQVMGVAIRATWTLTYVTRNPGHVLFPGRSYCGQTELAGIGVPDSALQKIQPTRMINDIALWGQHWPRPQSMGHKFDRGAVAVLSGPMVQSGASRLAARGALRSGAGIVTILAPESALAAHASQLTAIMLHLAADGNAIRAFANDDRLRTIVAGPGLGLDKNARAKIDACLAGGKQLILDADGLTLFQDDPNILFNQLKPNDILTPHVGEFARLFPDLIKEETGKLAITQAAAKRCGCIVVLKGADTVIAHPDGRAAINLNAPPDLATAGSGDVLAGFIAGLACQSLPDGRPMPAFDAACGGVWLHGACGQFAGPGLIAEDLPEALPGVLSKIFAGAVEG